MNDPVAISLAGVLDQLASPESRRAYENDWARYASWLEQQGVPVLEARARHVVAHLAGLREQGKAKSTAGRALSVIREVYGALVRDEHIEVNPAREVKNPKQSSEPRTPWLTEDELAKLLAAPATTWEERRDRLCVLLLLGLGWRRAEVARMRVEDFRDGTVTGVVKGGKRLTVGVPEWLQVEIATWCAHAGVDKGPLLPRAPLKPEAVSGGMVYKMVAAVAARAGVTINPHGLRRTTITLAGALGATLKERQLMVGHTSQSTTERYDRARDAAGNAPGRVFASMVSPVDVKEGD